MKNLVSSALMAFVGACGNPVGTVEEKQAPAPTASPVTPQNSPVTQAQTSPPPTQAPVISDKANQAYADKIIPVYDEKGNVVSEIMFGCYTVKGEPDGEGRIDISMTDRNGNVLNGEIDYKLTGPLTSNDKNCEGYFSTSAPKGPK